MQDSLPVPIVTEGTSLRVAFSIFSLENKFGTPAIKIVNSVSKPTLSQHPFIPKISFP